MRPSWGQRPIWRLILVVSIALLSNSVAEGAPASAEPGAPVAAKRASIGHWLDQRGQDHGRATPLADLMRAQVIFLGEVHDNPAHHRLQRQIIGQIMADKAPAGALAMEQFDLSHQAELDRVQSLADVSVEQIVRAGRFDRQGWSWPQYRNLIALAHAHHWPIIALNLSRRSAFAIARGGLAAASGPEQHVLRAFSSDLHLPLVQEAELERQLLSAHCGRIPAEYIPKLARAQVARDILMAHTLFRYLEKHPGVRLVAIVGRQHARKDRGAAYWLRRMAPTIRQVSIGLTPVDTDRSSRSRLERTAGFDWRVLTPKVESGDPCARFPAAGRDS